MAKIVIERTRMVRREVEIEDEHVNFSDLMRNLNNPSYLSEIEVDGNQTDFEEIDNSISIKMTDGIKTSHIT